MHHHRCNRDALSEDEATRLAIATWNREPMFHISSPIEGWQGPTPARHHDFIDVKDFPKHLARSALDGRDRSKGQGGGGAEAQKAARAACPQARNVEAVDQERLIGPRNKYSQPFTKESICQRQPAASASRGCESFCEAKPTAGYVLWPQSQATSRYRQSRADRIRPDALSSTASLPSRIVTVACCCSWPVNVK